MEKLDDIYSLIIACFVRKYSSKVIKVLNKLIYSFSKAEYFWIFKKHKKYFGEKPLIKSSKIWVYSDYKLINYISPINNFYLNYLIKEGIHHFTFKLSAREKVVKEKDFLTLGLYPLTIDYNSSDDFDSEVIMFGIDINNNWWIQQEDDWNNEKRNLLKSNTIYLQIETNKPDFKLVCTVDPQKYCVDLLDHYYEN